MDAYDPEEVARLVDDACAGRASFLTVGNRLFEKAGELFGDEQPASPLAPFVNAFSYDLVVGGSERREEYGAFVPMIETAAGSFPPRLESIDAEQIAAWESVHGLVQEPAARARLGDLLWTTKTGERPDLFARDAVVAYRAAAASWEGLDAADALTRSLELSLQLGDKAEAAATASRVVVAVEGALAESEEKPGVSLSLIEGLVEMPDPPPAVDGLLDQAASRYRGNVHVGDSIADMRAARASDPQVVEDIRRQQVQKWREVAESCEPLVALHHLQHGLALAKSFGLADEVERFRVALQRLDRDEMNFARIEAEVTVDSKVIEELISSLVAPTWSESLAAFGATGPPTGDALENERAVRELMKAHPLAFLFAHTTLGPENSVIRNSVTEEERFEVELVQQEVRAILLWGHLSIEALRRMGERNGKPTPEELEEHFRTGLGPADLAESFSRAVLAYVDGRYDESSLILAARIEPVIRKLARDAGLVVNREPDGIRPGGVRTLGMLLQTLRPVLADQSWWRYLWTALAEPLGLNLRNQLAHGLIEGSQLTAAVLLHIACFLRLLKPIEPDTPPD